MARSGATSGLEQQTASRVRYCSAAFLLLGIGVMSSLLWRTLSPLQGRVTLFAQTPEQNVTCATGATPKPRKPIDIDFLHKLQSCYGLMGQIVIGNVSSMVTLPRQWNTLYLLQQSLLVDGDTIEAGVAAGGMSALIMSMIACMNETHRVHYMADSWRGVPGANETRFRNESTTFTLGLVNVPEHLYLAEMRRWEKFWGNYGYKFPFEERKSMTMHKGWFKDTLPALSDRRWAFIRLDGDTYGSTYDSLEYLYPQLSCNGYIYVDDYWAFPECRKAAHDYMTKFGYDFEPYAVVERVGGLGAGKDIGHWMSNFSFETHPQTYPRYVAAAFWQKKC